MCMTDSGEANWSPLVLDEANALIERMTESDSTFSSLPFKTMLREKVGPNIKVNQNDVSKFLRHWYLKRGGKDTHTYKEKRAKGRMEHYDYTPKQKKKLADKIVEKVTGKKTTEKKKPATSAAAASTGKSVSKRLLNRLEKLASEDPVNVTTKRYQEALKDAVDALKDV